MHAKRHEYAAIDGNRLMKLKILRYSNCPIERSISDFRRQAARMQIRPQPSRTASSVELLQLAKDLFSVLIFYSFDDAMIVLKSHAQMTRVFS